MEDYINELVKRLKECVELSIPSDKIDSVNNLIERHAAELLVATKDSLDAEFVRSKFSNFINKSLSTVEALGLNELQYKAIRKLVLSEINGCLDMIVKRLKSELPIKDI